MLVTLFPKLQLPGLARVSLGIGNSEAEVDTFIRVLGEIAGKPRTSAEKHSDSMHNGTPLLPKAEVKKQMKDFTVDRARRVYS